MVRVLAQLIVLVVGLLRVTWRVRVVGEKVPDGPVVFCFWHGRQAGLLAFEHNRPTAVLTSYSKDGALQTRVMAGFGFRICRGSSSRGGAGGLKGLVRLLRSGVDVALSVDGPKGPAKQAKGGAIAAARLGGARLVPIHVVANRCWRFERAWDQFELPKPFARLTIHVGASCSPDGMLPQMLTSAINNLRNG